MHKMKIFITILALYEFAVLTILQIPDYCSVFFNSNFCVATHFKYFLLCFMLPTLIGLFFWWLPEISRLFCKNKCQCQTEFDNNLLSKQNIERLITAAIVMGIDKFIAHIQKTKKQGKAKK